MAVEGIASEQHHVRIEVARRVENAGKSPDPIAAVNLRGVKVIDVNVRGVNDDDVPALHYHFISFLVASSLSLRNLRYASPLITSGSRLRVSAFSWCSREPMTFSSAAVSVASTFLSRLAGAAIPLVTDHTWLKPCSLNVGASGRKRDRSGAITPSKRN